MNPEKSLEQSYLVLFKFLLLSKRRVFELGSEYGLTGMQTMMLFLLDHPRPMNNFRKIFNCDASNVTGIVDGLEQKQLVSRFPDPDDRRIKKVRLESDGRGLRALLLKDFMMHNSPLLSKLDQKELRTFIHLLEKITSGVEHV